MLVRDFEIVNPLRKKSGNELIVLSLTTFIMAKVSHNIFDLIFDIFFELKSFLYFVFLVVVSFRYFVVLIWGHLDVMSFGIHLNYSLTCFKRPSIQVTWKSLDRWLFIAV